MHLVRALVGLGLGLLGLDHEMEEAAADAAQRETVPVLACDLVWQSDLVLTSSYLVDLAEHVSFEARGHVWGHVDLQLDGIFLAHLYRHTYRFQLSYHGMISVQLQRVDVWARVRGKGRLGCQSE